MNIELQLNILPSEPIPTGCYLVHNHVGPVASLGRNGFRAWIQTRADNLEECHCDFGQCENAKLHQHHYRRHAPGPVAVPMWPTIDASAEAIGAGLDWIACRFRCAMPAAVHVDATIKRDVMPSAIGRLPAPGR
jgi:hypothetical protein